MMSKDSSNLTHVLRLQDKRCNTAFCLAVAAGSVDIAKIMIRNDSSLPEQLGFQGKTPLYYAVLFGHQKMALYLYSQPSLIPKEDLRGLFFTCINIGLYGEFKITPPFLIIILVSSHALIDFFFSYTLCINLFVNNYFSNCKAVKSYNSRVVVMIWKLPYVSFPLSLLIFFCYFYIFKVTILSFVYYIFYS